MSARSRKQNIHVVPAGRGFVARRARGRRLMRLPATQREAIVCAVREARRRRVEVVIHRPNGQIRDSDSYGPESRRHRDLKH